MTLFNKKSSSTATSIIKNSRKHKAKNKKIFYLSTKNAWQLWFCQCLNISVIALELSPWMLAIIALSLLWQSLILHKLNGNQYTEKAKNHYDIEKSPATQPNKQLSKQGGHVSPYLLSIFAILGCIAIVISAKEVGLLISMVHLLCFSYVLKAFELKARSDFYQLLLLGLFVLASSLIFRQDLAFSLINITLLVVNLSVLLQFFSAKMTFTTNIKVVVLMLGQSAILAVVFFLVFPRLSPFWQVPRAKSAETGLSDTVKPGDIANLTRSTKLAFRADFGQQAIPNYSQLYWRAMVLEDYDGRQWSTIKTASNSSKKSTAQLVSINTQRSDVLPVTYQVTVEPSFQKYLFALAPAVELGDSSGIKAKNDYTFTNFKIITQAKSYRLSSYLSEPLSLELADESRKINISYPQGSNPELEQLALELAHKYPQPQARAQAVLSLINQQNYSYTLQPPLLTNNSLDQFFFETKAGFCVHYASAFTFLMRASGIPARLVTGYLGGEYNGSSSSDETSAQGHLSIYQYDAHAWSEIWVENKGWMRVDPTSAVDPQRVNSGWSNELLQQQSALNNELFSLYQLKNFAWLNALRLQFDALDYQWTRWVIGFTTKQQYDLFKHWFGKVTAWKLALIMGLTLIITMVMLMIFLHLLNRTKLQKQSLSKSQLVYQKALILLAKEGLDKPLAMTVNDFAQQVRKQYPTLAIIFTRLSLSYNSLCYQTLSSDEENKLILTMQQQYKQLHYILKNNTLKK